MSFSHLHAYPRRRTGHINIWQNCKIKIDETEKATKKAITLRLLKGKILAAQFSHFYRRHHDSKLQQIRSL